MRLSSLDSASLVFELDFLAAVDIDVFASIVLNSSFDLALLALLAPLDSSSNNSNSTRLVGLIGLMSSLARGPNLMYDATVSECERILISSYEINITSLIKILLFCSK